MNFAPRRNFGTSPNPLTKALSLQSLPKKKFPKLPTLLKVNTSKGVSRIPTEEEIRQIHALRATVGVSSTLL